MGIGLVPELMSESNWNYVDAPGAAGASYGLQQQKSAILAARAVAGVGVALTNKISLGASVGAVTTRTRWTLPIFSNHSGGRRLEDTARSPHDGRGMERERGGDRTPSSRVQLSVA